MAPTETLQRRADVRAAGSRASDADTPLSRRAANRRRSLRRRRVYRLRRTAALALLLLFIGTVVARGSQDPAVALPRGSHLVGASTFPTGSGTTGDVSRAGTAPAAAKAIITAEPTSQAFEAMSGDGMGEVEEGAPEPTAAPGASLAQVQASAQGTVHPVAIPAQSWGTEGRAVRLSVEVGDGGSIDEATFAAPGAGIPRDTR